MSDPVREAVSPTAVLLGLAQLGSRAAEHPGHVQDAFVRDLETGGTSDEAMEIAHYGLEDLDEFGSGDRLGGGGFGDVFRVTYREKAYALKVAKDPSVSHGFEYNHREGWGERDE